MNQASKPGGPSREKKTAIFFCGKLLGGGFGQARGCAAGRCLCWAVLFCVFYGKYDQTNKTQSSQPPSSSALLPTALATSDLALRDRLASLNTGNRNPLTLVDAKRASYVGGRGTIGTAVGTWLVHGCVHGSRVGHGAGVGAYVGG